MVRAKNSIKEVILVTGLPIYNRGQKVPFFTSNQLLDVL
jgi:hypothetical protein